MNLVCVMRCFDNAIFKSYYEGDSYSFDDELRARYESIGFLKYFQTPEGKPAQVVAPKSVRAAPTLDELKEAAVSLNEYRDRTLAGIKLEAGGILAEARAEAARIIDEAVAAAKPAVEKDTPAG